jgi:hypothetical protein
MDVDELRRDLSRVAAEDEIDTTRAWLAIDTRAERLRRHRRIGSTLVAAGLVAIVALGLLALRGGPSDRANRISPATSETAPASPTTTTRSSGLGGIPYDFQGYVPGEEALVNQCVAAPLPSVCGLTNTETHADANGTVRGNFSPEQWIFTSDGWIDCLTQTCVLKVAANSDRLVNTVSVDLSGVGPVPRPDITMAIETSGPYAPDQDITIRITGAPPGIQGGASVCTKVPDDSASSGTCGAGGDAYFTIGPDGTATLQRFRLPALPCTAPASCEVVWDPGYDYPPLASHDIDYT